MCYNDQITELQPTIKVKIILDRDCLPKARFCHGETKTVRETDSICCKVFSAGTK